MTSEVPRPPSPQRQLANEANSAYLRARSEGNLLAALGHSLESYGWEIVAGVTSGNLKEMSYAAALVVLAPFVLPTGLAATVAIHCLRLITGQNKPDQG